jgi:hypothetical protein
VLNTLFTDAVGLRIAEIRGKVTLERMKYRGK